MLIASITENPQQDEIDDDDDVCNMLIYVFRVFLEVDVTENLGRCLIFAPYIYCL